MVENRRSLADRCATRTSTPMSNQLLVFDKAHSLQVDKGSTDAVYRKAGAAM